MTSPTLSSDRETRALYIRFSDEPVLGTIELSLSANVDVDREGNPVGFEVLNADSNLLATLAERPQRVVLRDLLEIDIE